MGISNLIKQGGSSIIAPLAFERTVTTPLLAGVTETLIEVTGKGIIDEAIVYHDSTGSDKCRLIIEVDGVEVFNHFNNNSLYSLSGLTSTPPSISTNNSYVFRIPSVSQQYPSNVSDYNPSPTSFAGGRVVIMTNPITFKSSVRIRFKNEHASNSITKRQYSLKGAYTT